MEGEKEEVVHTRKWPALEMRQVQPFLMTHLQFSILSSGLFSKTQQMLFHKAHSTKQEMLENEKRNKVIVKEEMLMP